MALVAVVDEVALNVVVGDMVHIIMLMYFRIRVHAFIHSL